MYLWPFSRAKGRVAAELTSDCLFICTKAEQASLIVASHAAHLHVLLANKAGRSEQMEAAEMALKDFQSANIHVQLASDFRTALRSAMEEPKQGAVSTLLGFPVYPLSVSACAACIYF